MKEKLTLTIDLDVLNAIEREMIRHQYHNKSRFIEFVLRQVMFSPEKKLQLIQKSFEGAVARQLALAEERNKLEEYIRAKREAEEILAEKPSENTKDALWGGDDESKTIMG